MLPQGPQRAQGCTHSQHIIWKLHIPVVAAAAASGARREGFGPPTSSQQTC